MLGVVNDLISLGSPLSFLFWAFILYYFFFRRRTVQRLLPRLILQEYRFVEDQTDPDGIVLELKARHPGIIALVMSWLGIANQSFLRVTNREVKVTVSGLFGTTHFVAPHTDITSAYGNLVKPLWQLQVGVVILAGVILSLVTGFGSVTTFDRFGPRTAPNWVALIIAAAIGGLFIFSYWRSRLLVVAYSTSEISNWYGMALKPTLMGSGNVTYETMLKSVLHISANIVNAHLPRDNQS
jgi:hypothetical protein